MESRTNKLPTIPLPVCHLQSDHSRTSQDFIEKLYQQNLQHILEKIFLALPKYDIQTCKNVSSFWCQIIVKYHRSKSARIQRILNYRIEEEWRKKKPDWQTRTLTPTLLYSGAGVDFIADKDHIAVAHSFPFEIIILNTNSLEVFKRLEKKGENGVPNQVQKVKMAMNEKYLVAYIHDTFDKSYYLIWDRERNFTLIPLKIETICICPLNTCKFFLRVEVTEMPCLKHGKLTIVNDAQTSDNLVFEEWDVFQKSKTQLDHFHQRRGAGRNYFVISDKFHFSCCNVPAGHLVWDKVMVNREPHLEALTDVYVAVSWNRTENSQIHDVYEIYNRADGSLVLSFLGYIESGSVRSIQICEDRLAFQGYLPTRLRRDIIIFDLKSGEEILCLNQNPEFRKLTNDYFHKGCFFHSNFVLEKTRILVFFRENIHVGEFWLSLD